MNKTPFSEYKTTEERIAAALERIAVALEKQQSGQPVVIPSGSACVSGPGYQEYIHPDGGRTIFGNPHEDLERIMPRTPQAAYVAEMRPLGPDFEKVWDDNVDKLYENGTDNTPKECEHDWPIPSSEKHGYFIHCKKCIEPKWVVGEDGWLPAEQDGAA